MVFDKAYFDAGVCRVGTQCEKWDGMIAAFGDESMIPMWVADMDFPSPPAVREALALVLDRGTWGYTISGKADKEALAAYWARRHNTVIDPESVTLSPCVVTGLKLGLRAVTKEGDGILINPAAYTHTSVAILDALKAVSIPAVEVHISDVDSREAFRQISYAGLACKHTIKGQGFDGYRQAMVWLKEHYGK